MFKNKDSFHGIFSFHKRLLIMEKKFFRLFKCSLLQENQVGLHLRTVLLKMFFLLQKKKEKKAFRKGLVKKPCRSFSFFFFKSPSLTINLTWTFRASSGLRNAVQQWLNSEKSVSLWLVKHILCLSLRFAFSVSFILTSSSVVVHPGYLGDELNPAWFEVHVCNVILS